MRFEITKTRFKTPQYAQKDPEVRRLEIQADLHEKFPITHETQVLKAANGANYIHETFFVEIEDLTQLMALIAEFDSSVVVDQNPPSIELYNDYRE